MIKYLRSMKIGKRYYATIESTQQIAVFEYKERASLDEFIFQDEKQELKLSRNEVKRMLTEYNGDLDGKTCETCLYCNPTEKTTKRKPLYFCEKSKNDIFIKNPCFGYEKKA